MTTVFVADGRQPAHPPAGTMVRPFPGYYLYYPDLHGTTALELSKAASSRTKK
ncbi:MULTISPECIES: hypothetical protein [unclassified Rhizobium]|jgi:hypothetical protein|uniref:hypothetical protein n=1 Tax=unclassified Rhizobium TaxID=2613769 RepID=UPI0013AFC68A|nr:MULTISPECIES: hypothetical protein [unclassified Rhizobium]MBB3444452.1 hypothetical protein [Rhizobium sp. BK379]MBB3564410.1 hypothetical protein [Rhizobium sp. BK512]